MTDKTEEKQKDWLFKKGQSGNPNGRPKGSVSIKDRIRQRLQENPDEFENLVEFYLKDKKMRDLLWKMLEGLPKQQTEHSGNIQVIFNCDERGFNPKLSTERISEGIDDVSQEVQDSSIPS